MNKYRIISAKGYWLERGCGYTQDESKAAVFTLDDMRSFNLDQCTLLRVNDYELQTSVIVNNNNE